MAYTDYDLKSALPNKSFNNDGTTTDLLGNPVIAAVPAYENKTALPNKWLNPDGTYSTTLELISGAIDTELFVVVEELPEEGLHNKIYLLQDGDNLIEYLWIDGKWDPIGMIQFDLSQYSTTEQMNAAIAAALNSAKAYADVLFGNIIPDVYNIVLRSGNITLNSAELAQLQAIRDTDSDGPCVLIISFSNANGKYMYFSTTHKLSGTIVCNDPGAVWGTDNNDTSTIYKATYTLNITVLASGQIDRCTASYTSTPIATYIATNKIYTRPFTPTQPYHPATKKYVDDNAVSFKSFPNDFNTSGTTQQFLNSIKALNLPSGMVYLGQVSLSDMPSGVTVQAEVEAYIYPQNVVYCIMRSAETSPYQWECNSYEYRGWEPIDMTAKSYADTNFLKKDNTTAYTPTANYHPATKKYVDDVIANSVTDALGGSY